MHFQRKVSIIPIGKYQGKCLHELTDSQVMSMYSYWHEHLSHHFFFSDLESEYNYRDLLAIKKKQPPKRNVGKQVFAMAIMKCGKCGASTKRKEKNSKKRLSCSCGGQFSMVSVIEPKSEYKSAVPARKGGVKVYFICDTNETYVKIGKSKSPDERLKEIQTGFPLKLKLLHSQYETVLVNEKSLHAKFKKYLSHGEWFKFTNEIREFVSHLQRV